MPATSIRIEAEGAIAVITLDRPRSGNSITEGMAAELRDACRRVSRDDRARVVVVTGSGGPSVFPVCSSMGTRHRFMLPPRELEK